MSKHRNATPEELEKAKDYAEQIAKGQVIDLGNIPSRELGLIAQGLMLRGEESGEQEQTIPGAPISSDSLPE